MTSLLCCGRAVALTTLSIFVLSLVSLRRTQSDLVVEPRIKQAHPVILQADTLFAIGDLHGDLEQGLTALQLAGLVTPNGLWSGGKAVLVQTGDLLDRGPKSLELVQLFERLKVSSTAGRQLRCPRDRAKLFWCMTRPFARGRQQVLVAGCTPSWATTRP